MNFEKLYEEYEKEVNKMSNGLVKTDKAEYLKMIAVYQVIQQETFKEMQRYNIKYHLKGTL